jgi:hypothetical protein
MFFAALPLIVPVLMLVFSSMGYRENIGPFILVGSISILTSVWLFIMLRAMAVRPGQQGLFLKAVNGERLLAWKELRSVYVHRVKRGKSRHLELVLEPANQEVARLNTKLYSRRSLQAIAAAIVTRAPQAAIDDRVRDFAEGRFPGRIL